MIRSLAPMKSGPLGNVVQLHFIVFRLSILNGHYVFQIFFPLCDEDFLTIRVVCHSKFGSIVKVVFFEHVEVPGLGGSRAVGLKASGTKTHCLTEWWYSKVFL